MYIIALCMADAAARSIGVCDAKLRSDKCKYMRWVVVVMFSFYYMGRLKDEVDI